MKTYAAGLAILCNNEYGDVYYNEADNHVHVCLGDYNPFDSKSLNEFITDAVKGGNFDSTTQVKVTIDYEFFPKGEGWKKIVSKIKVL